MARSSGDANDDKVEPLEPGTVVVGNDPAAGNEPGGTPDQLGQGAKFANPDPPSSGVGQPSDQGYETYGMDTTIPGGHYIVNDQHVNADGQVIEAPKESRKPKK